MRDTFDIRDPQRRDPQREGVRLSASESIGAGADPGQRSSGWSPTADRKDLVLKLATSAARSHRPSTLGVVVWPHFPWSHDRICSLASYMSFNACVTPSCGHPLLSMSSSSTRPNTLPSRHETVSCEAFTLLAPTRPPSPVTVNSCEGSSIHLP